MRYLPNRGHWIWMDFTPHAGHETAGRRPALVLSSAEFNKITGMCLACPATTTRRPYRFQVPIPDGEPVDGVVMPEQIRSVDFVARRVQFISVASPELVEQVTAIVESLIDPQ